MDEVKWSPEDIRNFKAFFKGSLGRVLVEQLEKARQNADSVVFLANQYQGDDLQNAVLKAVGKIEAFNQALAIIENLSGDL